MKPFNWQKELGREGHRLVFAGQPFAMHCHHYNINLQKMLEDALGDAGVELLYTSAEESGFHNFGFILSQFTNIKTLKSKIEMASVFYQNCGLGIIHFQEVGPQGGRIVSPASHHVTGWMAKHGKRDTPGCHFMRGWIAGVMAAIFNHRTGFYYVDELCCKMMRNKECVFEVTVKK